MGLLTQVMQEYGGFGIRKVIPNNDHAGTTCMNVETMTIQVLLANGILLCDRIWPIYDFVAS